MYPFLIARQLQIWIAIVWHAGQFQRSPCHKIPVNLQQQPANYQSFAAVWHIPQIILAPGDLLFAESDQAIKTVDNCFALRLIVKYECEVVLEYISGASRKLLPLYLQQDEYKKNEANYSR